MNRELGSLLLLLTLLAPGARAQESGLESPVDLATIDRGIAREPLYGTDTPLYALLVFGAAAKPRVWIVLDGDTLYVDRNGDGDLTQPGETVAATGSTFEVGSIGEADGTPRQGSLRVRRMDDQFRLTLRVKGRERYYAGFDPGDPLRFAPRRVDAPVIHFGGALTLRLYNVPPTFFPGTPSQLNLSMGTPGLGNGSFAAIDASIVIDCDIAPVAEIAFQHREAGREPIRVRAPIEGD